MTNHYKMIRQMRGVPGVIPQRLEDALTIRHCALSLVGEPIIYPHINDFVGLLHQRRISSFLVTNAQVPLTPSPSHTHTHTLVIRCSLVSLTLSYETTTKFPEKIAALVCGLFALARSFYSPSYCRKLRWTKDPVTQLYVSVDAATPDTLKAVDRPLFKDFWERCSFIHWPILLFFHLWPAHTGGWRIGSWIRWRRWGRRASGQYTASRC